LSFFQKKKKDAKAICKTVGDATDQLNGSQVKCKGLSTKTSTSYATVLKSKQYKEAK
jgi:hypothetical protein